MDDVAEMDPDDLSTNPLFIEAEDMVLSEGFEVQQDAVASGGAWIETSARGVARYDFVGPSALVFLVV